MISLIIKHKKKETERKRQRENKKGRDGEEKKERNQIENTKNTISKTWKRVPGCQHSPGRHSRTRGKRERRTKRITKGIMGKKIPELKDLSLQSEIGHQSVSRNNFKSYAEVQIGKNIYIKT